MLSATEKSLVERDGELPALRTLLDPAEFLTTLSPHFPDSGLRDARRTYLRYKPRVNCLVAYELETADGAIAVYAKAYGLDAEVKLEKDHRRRQARSELGAGQVVLEDLAMSVFVFPNDSKLSALSRLGDLDGRRSLLSSVFPERDDLEGIEFETIRYKPERRYVACLEKNGEPWAALKLYTEDGYRGSRRPAVGFLPGEVLRVPELLGKSDRLGAVATGWMPGRVLSEVLTEPGFDPGNLSAVGAALAELHRQDPKGLSHRTREEEIATLRSLTDFASFLVPELAKSIAELARRLASALEATPVEWTSIHADFYAKQVLIDARRVGFLDLDGGVRADAALDLGLFIAHLERDVLRRKLEPDRIAVLTQAFLEGYSGASARRLPIELFTAFGLFQLLHHPFRHCEPDWVERTAGIVERSGAILSDGVARGGGGGRSLRSPIPLPDIAVTDRFGVTDDERMPFLRQALEPAELQARFRESVFPEREFHLYAARVTRHKRGRRCVIEFDLELDSSGEDRQAVTLLGKFRARGLDRRAYETTEALRQAGLGPESSCGTSVPEPFGAIPDWNMWLQRKVAGLSATDLLGHPGRRGSPGGVDGVELVRRIAAAIHHLHAANVPSARGRHTMEDELRILHERLSLVADERPDWAGRLRRVLDASDRLGASVPEPSWVGIHRDFYADHVIVGEDRLYLIDLDLYCEGDPGLDVGNYSAHLIEYGLRVLGDVDALQEERTALEESFLKLAGEEVRAALQAYTVLTVVRHIHISTLLPKRRAFTERLLELSERLLSASAAS